MKTLIATGLLAIATLFTACKCTLADKTAAETVVEYWDKVAATRPLENWEIALQSAALIRVQYCASQVELPASSIEEARATVRDYLDLAAKRPLTAGEAAQYGRAGGILEIKTKAKVQGAASLVHSSIDKYNPKLPIWR